MTKGGPQYYNYSINSQEEKTMENKKHILNRVIACAVVVFVAVTATIMSGVAGIELPKWSEVFLTRASAASYSGKCGDKAVWSLNTSTGVLYIDGSGDMYDYDYGDIYDYGYDDFYDYYYAPWEKYKSYIRSVDIGNSVTSIGDYAFYNCTGLKSITIPDSITSIGFSAFAACTGLTKINWNAEDVKNYGADVFRHAGNGMDVVFGNSVKRIPDQAFTNSEMYSYSGAYIKSVTISDSVTHIGDRAFFECGTLTNVKISDSVTSIGESAFGYTGLTSVTIPAGVTSIGAGAFGGCAQLTKIYWNAEKVRDLSEKDYIEYYCDGYYIDYHGVGMFLNSGTAGPGIRVVFGDNVKTIPAYAFERCTGLKSVTIGKSVTSIGSHAFYDCTGLKSITIPDSITSIGYSAFSGCTGLKSVNITDLAAWCKISFVFDGWDGVSSNPLWYGAKLYINGKLATNIIIPDGITSIRDYAFGGYTGLKSVTIGKSVKSIGSHAFYDCTGLKSVTIGKSVKSIGSFAFSECTRLERINWTAVNVRDFDPSNRAFCDTGTAGDGIVVVFGDNVKIIPAYAFENCTGLKSITIPDSVKKIGSKAFGGFNAQIRFTGKPPAFSSDTFSGLKGTVLYPYKISEWKSAIKSKYGGQFTWVCYSKGKLTELKIKSMPKKTVYYQGQTANYSGLSLSAKWSDGFSAVITPDSKIYDVSISGFSSKTPGLKTVTATVGGKSVKFRLGVHKLNTFTGKKSKYPESAHNYANNLNETKTYKCTNALRLVVTFSNKTYVEKDGDYIYVNGTRYTGNQLAGKTITIKGDTLTVKLVSDDYGRGYGYSIDKIVVTRVEHINKTRITPATTAKDGTVITACEACGKVAKKAVIYKASSVKLSRTKYTYNGKVQRPTVTVKNSKGATLKNGTHYTVTYSSGCKNPGKYAVKITFKGYYTGTKTLYFTIAPTTPSLTVTAGAKKATLKWNKQVGATGYVVYMATSKTGKYSRIAVLKGNSAVSYAKTGLTTGKTYYFKVAAYSTSGGSNVYSSFSSVKAVKVK